MNARRRVRFGAVLCPLLLFAACKREVYSAAESRAALNVADARAMTNDDGGPPYDGGRDSGAPGATEATLDAGVPDDGGPPPDSGVDSGPPDSGPPDSGPPDFGLPDSGAPDSDPPDSGGPDSGPPDSGFGPPDSGFSDSGFPDSGFPDSGSPDSGDAGDACTCAVPIEEDPQPPLSFCSGFACGDEAGTCLPASVICDGVVDCPNGADELECGTTGCYSWQLTCPDSSCIDDPRICDGVADCPDGYDELNCQGLCSGSAVACPDGSCGVPCDGIMDCSDGSDEAPWLCAPDRGTPRCATTTF